LRGGAGEGYALIAGDFCIVADTGFASQADARELVRRWNAHEALVEALEAAERQLLDGVAREKARRALAAAKED
jgi:hypothetical protein